MSGRARARALVPAALLTLLLALPSGLYPDIRILPSPAETNSSTIHTTSVHAPGTHTAPAVAHPDAGPPPSAVFNRVCTGTATNNCLSGPTQRKGVAMAWDPTDGYLLVFGGGTTGSAGLKNDSFKWQKGAWFPLNTPNTLSFRSNASLVWDAADGYAVMFGGFTAGAGEFSLQTFKFVGGTWSLVIPTVRPQASVAACMVYVPQVGSGGSATGGYVLLFGGAGKTNASASNWYGYTWKFSAGLWTNISANVGAAPGARGYSQCTYDPTDGYVLLFGGMQVGGATTLADTWKFVPTHNSGAFGGNWTSLAPTGAPPASWMGNLLYVTATQQVLLFQGAAGTLAAPTDPSGGVAVWSWTGSSTTWANVSATVGFGQSGNPNPKPGYDSAMADIPTYSYAYRFAGQTVSLVTSNVSYAVGNLLGGYSTENLGEIVNGSSMKYYSNTTGGIGPFKFVYSALPTGCSTSNTSALACTPTGPGVYGAVSVVFTGSDGYNVTIVGLGLVVDPKAVGTGSIVSLTRTATINASLFWGIRHVQNPIFNSTIMALQNASPFTWVRTGSNCDAYNYTANLQYASNGASSALNFNWSSLRAYRNVTHSKIILCVGGEINNAGYAANQVAYIETQQHFRPDLLSIGNEPSFWNHFNKPFASWSASDNLAPTKLQYARMVQNYTAAIHGVDPTLPIIGIQAGSGAFTDPSWINQTVAINGPNLSAVAYHLYPQSKMTNYVPVSDFFTNLSKVGQATLYDRQNITGACPTCKKILLLNDEFNSAMASDVNPWQAGYPQVAWIAAGAAQEIQQNASQFMFFDFVDNGVLALVNSSSGLVRSSFYLYSNVLGHLNLGPVYTAPLNTSVRGIYAVETGNNPRTLLLVNTNTSVTFQLTGGVGFPLGNAARSWTDDPTNLTRSATYFTVGGFRPLVTLTTITVPPMGVLVLASGNVTGNSSGGGGGVFSSGNPWFFPAVAAGLAGGVLAFAVYAGGRRRS
ncbi:MAG TPA: hypothetical protein VGV89_01590 [Thermoplasmata archaeon]|nr:hypothetical protein [Thermoplasmata archaeon]